MSTTPDDVGPAYILPETPRFSPWDYVVFIMVLALSAFIGVFYGCRGGGQKTTKEFLMADRQMSAFPVALSLLASFMSAITLLGTPAEIYVYGTQYWMIWLSYCFVIPLSAHMFVPVFYRLNITSVFEYLEMRFSKGVRLCGCIAYIIQMTMYMAIVLYAPSLALSAVTGLNVWITVFSVGIVCTFYTSLGGMKAVMWTDVFQIIIMFAGLFAILAQGSVDHGGFSNIWSYLEEGDRVEFLNFDPDPKVRHTVWCLVIGGTFTWIAIYGVNQAQVQRTLTTKTLKSAQIALWFNVFGLTALLTICSLCGMVVYAEYRDCDPLVTERIQASDQLLPLYVMDRLTHMKGVPGLFTSCLFSGALSTISSGLNSLSAVVLQDIVRSRLYPNMSEERATLVSKIIALVFGVICIALTFVAAQLGGVLQAALGIFGMIGGPQLGLYVLGILYPWANKWGAYAGFFSGLIVTMWIGIGAQIYKPDVYKPPVSTAACLNPNVTLFTTTLSSLNVTETIPLEQQAGYLSVYELSYMWYSAVACVTVTVVGLIVSFVTGANDVDSVDTKLLIPFFDVFCCFLPASWRLKLKCNLDYDASDDRDNLSEKINDFGNENSLQYRSPINGYDGHSAEKGHRNDNGNGSDDTLPAYSTLNGANMSTLNSRQGLVNPAMVPDYDQEHYEVNPAMTPELGQHHTSTHL